MRRKSPLLAALLGVSAFVGVGAAASREIREKFDQRLIPFGQPRTLPDYELVRIEKAEAKRRRKAAKPA